MIGGEGGKKLSIHSKGKKVSRWKEKLSTHCKQETSWMENN
jgi:hypothetical protein